MSTQPEVLIRADELEAIGAESSLARAMAAHSLRLLYAENQRLHEVNAELVAVLQNVLKRIDDSWEWWIDVPERGGFDRSMIESAITKATGEQP